MTDIKVRRRTAALWLQYMKMEYILWTFIKAEKTTNWKFYLQAISHMFPYLAASGHNLQSMFQLKSDNPEIYKCKVFMLYDAATGIVMDHRPTFKRSAQSIIFWTLVIASKSINSMSRSTPSFTFRDLCLRAAQQTTLNLCSSMRCVQTGLHPLKHHGVSWDKQTNQRADALYSKLDYNLLQIH